jgi:Divergent InlB B-repeat domain
MNHQYAGKNFRGLWIYVFIAVAGWVNNAGAADLQLSWNDNSSNESGFEIERKTGTSGTFSKRATVGANVKTYVDTGLPGTTTFCYRVRAYNSAGKSAFTPEACKTTPSGTPPASNLITREAESGTLTAPMVIGSDSTASGGKFAQVPEGKGNNYNKSSNGGPGEVRFSISIPSSGTRALWARTKAPSGTSDSFFVTRNGTLVKEWHVPASTTWKWNKVTNVSLSAGTVNLAFRQREDGTKLDQIILTTDLSFTPGQSAPALALAAAAGAGPVLSVNVVKNLSNSGSGDGTVTTSPAGIDCGSDCQKPFSAGTVVKLIATPAAGSTFGGWSGHADCNNGMLTITSDIACSATFNAQTLGLHLTKSGSGTGNVASSPSGISCGSDCSEPFPSGTSVALTATAAKGSIFKGWRGGGCSGTTKCTVVVSGSTSVSAVFETNEADQGIAKIGIYRPSTGHIFLDRNGNGEWEGCSTDICMKWSAQASGIPVAGDWEGNGTTRVGTFDSASGVWHLDRDGNGRWDGCTVDICVKSFGAAGDIPVLGSNGTNRPSLGIYRAKGGIWQFDANGNNVFDDCQADTCYSRFGGQGMFGLAGDWDGDGKSKIATFEPESGFWRIDANDNGVRNGCAVDTCYSGFGQKDDVPVAGDWDGSGKTKIGVFRPSTGQWFLDKNGNGRLDSCGVDICITAFGQPEDKPLVGKWLGVGSP